MGGSICGAMNSYDRLVPPERYGLDQLVVQRVERPYPSNRSPITRVVGRSPRFAGNLADTDVMTVRDVVEYLKVKAFPKR
jgi:hypothetical protein